MNKYVSMTNFLWQVPPPVPLLQWLARGALKQNLLQAIRRWVWLRLLYGEDDSRLPLSDTFTYADWRDCFFAASHPTHEKQPDYHDPACPCAKPTAAWLFHPDLNLVLPQWEHHCQIEANQQSLQTQVETFKQALADHNLCPPNLIELLFETRLFGFTRRTLYGDLRVLTDMHWLTQQRASFAKVDAWPDLPYSDTPHTTWVSKTEASFLTQPDLASFAETLSRPLGGSRRFFVHIDYVVSRQKLDRVDDWQALLVEVWQQSPVPPVSITYQPAGGRHPLALVVYPVCIYYYRRGPYLCAFGQVLGDSSPSLDWRNYRLDRISAINPMTWDSTNVPPDLQKRYQSQTLPIPDEIEMAMDDAWGFDYYQPIQYLILRFDPVWDARYIQGTVRHTTFQKISYDQVERLIRQHLQGEPQQHMLKVLHQRSVDDAYYQAQFRQNDPNVRQRLRAWRPHVEVLMPWELRQRTLQEIQQEMTFYDL